MKRALLSLVLIWSCALSAQDLRDHRLTISSQGAVRVTPDVIKCSISLSGNYFRQQGATEDKICDKILSDLKIKSQAKRVVGEESGEEEGDYEGERGYNSPRYYSRNYTISFTKVEDFTKLSDACAKLQLTSDAKLGCNLTYLGLSDSTLQAARLAAFKDALAQAKIKAGYVTTVLGGNVGPLLTVTDNGNSYEEDDEDGTDGLGYRYADYYLPGKPLKIPFVSYVNVIFELR